MKKIAFYVFLLFLPILLHAQTTVPVEIDYSTPRELEIGGIEVEGLQYLDAGVVKSVSGLVVGQTLQVPGTEISKAIDNLWKQGLFDNITISAEQIEGKIVYLKIKLTEMPRLSTYKFEGVRKGEADNLKEKVNISRGDVVTQNELNKIEYNVRNYFIEKGFYNVKVDAFTKRDTALTNNVNLIVEISKGAKVKVQSINFSGNSTIASAKLRRAMKETRERPFRKKRSEFAKARFNYNIFKSAKLDADKYTNDKLAIISKYNELGYRDAKIVSDTIKRIDDKKVDIVIKVDEGRKYFFRNIVFVGNTKYPTKDLETLLRVKKGDVYNQTHLEKNLYMNMEDGGDISSLYMDNGYLFFSVTPVEVNIENDSIDLEIRIYEGQQARINKVYIKGNIKTNDHVILREIRTRPGDLFSRADIIRTQRELAQLRYFDQEKLGVNPKPNPVDGTVDIEYVVEEISSDQVELSGGWGAGRVIGTLGVSFNNFSSRNMFKKGEWTPLPSGDGQKLSLRAQSNGLYYQSYSASFTEPWLGGKKPNSLSVSLYHSVQNFSGLPKSDPNRRGIAINGVSVGLGSRMRWPDDYFTSYGSISFQNYHLDNYEFIPSFKDGISNTISLGTVISRNSIDAPIFPRAGSEISLSVSATPPFSLLSNKDYTDITAQERYRWTEFHKWKIKTAHYARLVQNLVLTTRAGFGFIGLYNKEAGLTPFGRFYLGGDGLTGYALDDREIVALRGYENNSLTPEDNTFMGGSIYNKLTVELRYPLSLNPSATIYVLGFAEAGNAWMKFSKFNPFDVKRSAGVGFRIFLPMFGLLGLDWGYGFDKVPGQLQPSGSQFHFSIGQSID